MKAVLCLLFALSASGFGAEVKLVARVADGDELVTSDSLQVRLLGIEAPELDEPGGDISRDVLEKYVLGRRVRLEQETESRIQGRPDWSLLRYVFVGDTLVNAVLVRKGFAAVELPDTNLEYGDSLLSLEQIAARAEKGLWPFGVFEPPETGTSGQWRADTADSDPWLETVPWDRAHEYYGRLVRVVGKVVAAYRSDKVFIMNFHQDYRRHFKAAVFAGDLDKFPPYPEDFYKKRVVRVTGLVREYEGAPEMILEDPGQIEILE